ncbi:hypothetical protein ONE63_003580 [Megalurothrips usitatus]|uniref:Uncharacterized protein n=1 Tax=Megalurothrips usitatus TaxID=439358 RepID=A0AAV7X7B9_9NEOP|nr:hypothetical protein ONE63_003580 [Megalurothrips usitatus]
MDFSWGNEGHQRTNFTASLLTNTQPYGRDYVSGELMFVVERRIVDRINTRGDGQKPAVRRAYELAVREYGHTQYAATVLVQEAQTQLRVRPLVWWSNMAVQFRAIPLSGVGIGPAEPALPCSDDNKRCDCPPTVRGYRCLQGSAAECEENEFQCSNGECYDSNCRCNGINNCSDGSDEGVPLCSAPNTTVRIGDVLHTRVQYKEEHGAVGFLLCSNAACSSLWVGNCTDNSGSLEYESGTGCNSEGAKRFVLLSPT